MRSLVEYELGNETMRWNELEKGIMKPSNGIEGAVGEKEETLDSNTRKQMIIRIILSGTKSELTLSRTWDL